MEFKWFLHGIFASLRWRLTFIAIIALVVFFLWRQQQSWPSKQVNISGKVINAKSGRPVARAKIILTVWDISFWEGHPIVFGLLADEEGRFRFRKTFDFEVDNVNIEVCTPNNDYVYYNSVENLWDQSFEVGNPHPKKGEIYSYQKYEEFHKSVQWGNEVLFSRP